MSPSLRRAPVTRLLPWLLALFFLSLGIALPAQEDQGHVTPLLGSPSFDGRLVLEAYAAAYPGRFSAPEMVGGDWTIRLDGQRFAWAGGRLLPAGEGTRLVAAAGSATAASAWSPHSFYTYPKELPPQAALSAAEKERLIAAAAERDRRPLEDNPAFFDLLWGAADEQSSWDRQKTLLFFGREILVHRDLLEELTLIEAEIRAAAQRDRSVGNWIEGIGSVGGYLWRRIAGTKSRSLHAYGIAIDLVPARAGGKAWYWRDARASGLPWYELPYARRISLPPVVIHAFESRGFVWGGKWRFWDDVHFEYRPEILILNGQAPLIQAGPVPVTAL